MENRRFSIISRDLYIYTRIVRVREGTSVNFGLNLHILDLKMRGFSWSHREMPSGGVGKEGMVCGYDT